MSRYQIACTVQPQFLPDQSAPHEGIYSFAYTVTVTNTGEAAAQLISRHWIICDANGLREEVKGLGVVGQQPLMRLRTRSGTMHGSYFFVAEDATRFEAEIALFVLEEESSLPRVIH
jgi:ApaG protein